MRTNLLLCGLVAAVGLTSIQVFADNKSLSKLDLDSARIQTVSNYFKAIEARDVSKMADLFSDNGRVISTSRGEMPAVAFFSDFLPYLQTAEVVVHEIYPGHHHSDRYSASLNIHWVMNNNKSGDGRYSDEFFFAKGSAKLAEVIMYENKFAK